MVLFIKLLGNVVIDMLLLNTLFLLVNLVVVLMKFDAYKFLGLFYFYLLYFSGKCNVSAIITTLRFHDNIFIVMPYYEHHKFQVKINKKIKKI